jgi:hypothetical protein
MPTMLLTIAHPVPVRWLPPRARRERVAFELAVTPVEVPEVPHGSLEGQERECGFFSAGYQSFRIHRGRCFERVHVGMLDPHASAHVRPATIAEVAAHLSSAGTGPSGLARPGTPLCALANGHSGAGDRGAALAGAIHARAAADNTAAARAALAGFARDRLLTDGEAFYVARTMPALNLSAWKSNYVVYRPGPSVADGASFEVPRLDRVRAVMAGMAGFYGRDDVVAKVVKAIGTLSSTFSAFPSAGDDLLAFRNDGPEALARLVARARERGVAEDALRPAAEIEARLHAHADMGRIGGVRPEDYETVEGLLASGLRALDEAAPGMLGVKPLLAYAEGVMLPLRHGATLPIDDAEALDRLAPAP